MRPVIYVTLPLWLWACSSDAVAPPPKPPVGSLEPVVVSDGGTDIVTAKERALPDLYAKALSSSDAGIASLVPLLNPDMAEFSSPGMPPAHDPSGIVAAHRALFGGFDDRKLTLTRVWRTPNEESLEWVLTGKHTGTWMGVAATQKSVAFKGLTLLWTKDDGTVVDIHVYFDVGLLKAQLSGTAPKDVAALPPPSPPTGPAQVFELPPGSTPQPDNVGVVKGWLDALENNRESDYEGALADSYEIDTLESATPMRTKDDAKKYYAATHKAIGQLDTTVNNAWNVMQYAIVEYDLDGEQYGAYSWLPLLASLPARSTQLAHFDLVDVCEIKDGKISRIWRYDNPSQMLGASSSAVADAGVHPDASARADASARP
jgi:SnoaL-like polyketide cyclase